MSLDIKVDNGSDVILTCRISVFNVYRPIYAQGRRHAMKSDMALVCEGRDLDWVPRTGYPGLGTLVPVLIPILARYVCVLFNVLNAMYSTNPLGHCSLNAKQYNANTAFAKAISDCVVLLKVVWSYGMAMATAAIHTLPSKRME